MRIRIGLAVIFVAALLMAGGSVIHAAQQQAPPPSCEESPGFHKLDFWVGEWDVFAGDGYEQKAGTNRIEKILDGCAVMEHWRGEGGGEGKSLFFYTPATDTWKQVWVTGNATRRGGVKEKTLVEEFADGGTRFQGIITLPDGGSYLDRTTLAPMEDGKVRQVIEISSDGGETWRTTFDAVYIPREKAMD